MTSEAEAKIIHMTHVAQKSNVQSQYLINTNKYK